MTKDVRILLGRRKTPKQRVHAYMFMGGLNSQVLHNVWMLRQRPKHIALELQSLLNFMVSSVELVTGSLWEFDLFHCHDLSGSSIEPQIYPAIAPFAYQVPSYPFESH